LITKVLIDSTHISVSMSVNNSLKTSKYGITIEVPDHIIEELISKGQKPQDVLSKYIERLGKKEDVDYIISYSKGLDSKKKSDVKTEKTIQTTGREWTYEQFDEYMKLLIKQAKLRESVRDLISMLIAYYQTGSRPTSEELREARAFCEGDKWYEELRIAKSRLTIAAKHMGLPTFFLRAYGSSLKRRHPIQEEVYEYLVQWFSENENVLTKYEHEPTPRSLM
jgi:hypothetical protein